MKFLKAIYSTAKFACNGTAKGGVTTMLALITDCDDIIEVLAIKKGSQRL